MAAPTYQYATGPLTSTTGGNISCSAGSKVGDLHFLVCETTGGESVTAPTNPSLWTEVSASPQDTGASGTRLTLFYRFATAAGALQTTIADSGDHNIAVMFGFRSVNTAVPIGGIGGQTNAASTTCTWPSITKQRSDSLIVGFATTPTDSGSSDFLSPLTNANLLTKTNLGIVQSTAGDGGGYYVWYATAAAGDIGTTTVPLNISVATSVIILELMPITARASMLNGTDGFPVGMPVKFLPLRGS